MSAFKKRLSDLGFASYGEYLRSAHWSVFKATYKASGRSVKCAVCQVGPIQLHHHTYDRLGAELLDDVTPLCRIHHVAVHEWIKSHPKKFVEHTSEAVAMLRGGPIVVRSTEPPRILRNRKRSLSDASLANRRAIAIDAADLVDHAKHLVQQKQCRRQYRKIKAIEAMGRAGDRQGLKKYIAELEKKPNPLPKPISVVSGHPKQPTVVTKPRATKPFQLNAKAEPDRASGPRMLALMGIAKRSK